MMKITNLASFAVVVGLSFLNTSCGGPKPEPAEDIKSSTEAPLVGTFYMVGYQGTSAKTYISHKLIGADTDWTLNCSVPVGDFNTSNSNISCYIEAHELDLFAKGVTISAAIPAGLCEYFEEEPYYYFKNLPGVGTASFPSYSATDPVCSFDYTLQNGQNCCTGNWSIPVGVAGAATQPPRNGKYNGNFANCYSGPNIKEVAKSANGIPTATLYAQSADGVKISRPLKGLLDGAVSRTNVRLANFYSPSDHSHVTANPTLSGNAPIAFDYQTDTASGTTYPTSPFYRYTCYDTNKEIRARITLSVREWNTIAELHQGGDPNMTGVLPNGDLVNDYYDWKDFGDLGNSLFPGSNE